LALYIPEMERWKEQRQHVREMVHLSGSAVCDEGLRRIPIYVINLSKAGAMVELPENAKLPDRIELLFHHSAEPSRVIWREGKLAGFQFAEAPELIAP
jgi:PilZ domain-containing protein